MLVSYVFGKDFVGLRVNENLDETNTELLHCMITIGQTIQNRRNRSEQLKKYNIIMHKGDLGAYRGRTPPAS